MRSRGSAVAGFPSWIALQRPVPSSAARRFVRCHGFASPGRGPDLPGRSCASCTPGNRSGDGRSNRVGAWTVIPSGWCLTYSKAGVRSRFKPGCEMARARLRSSMCGGPACNVEAGESRAAILERGCAWFGESFSRFRIHVTKVLRCCCRITGMAVEMRQTYPPKRSWKPSGRGSRRWPISRDSMTRCHFRIAARHLRKDNVCGLEGPRSAR